MKKCLLLSLIILFNFSILFSADWDLISKIVASDRSSDEYFGNEVAISGNFAIVGAYRENKSIDEGEIIHNAGAAYIFRFDGSEWVEMQKLVASNRGEDYYFGYSVDICGDYAIVGAREEDVAGGHKEGAAYIFHYDGTNWAQQDRIYADDRQFGDYFGYSVALTENRAVIGAIYQDYAGAGSDSLGQAGAAYVFSRSGTSWIQSAKLVAKYRSEGDEFGSHVAMSGSNIVVGVPLEDMDEDSLDYEMSAGAAYVFSYDGTHWSQSKKLLASDRNSYDQFGCSVDIDGSTIVVGAWMEDHDVDGLNTKEKAGSAYIFDYAGSAWTETQKITDSYRWVGEYFGYDVAIEDDYIIVGATQEYHDSSNVNFVSNAGGAFIFKNTAGVWQESEKITAYVRSDDDHFGNSVDISGDVVLVGASGEDHDADEANTIYGSGSAYVFSTGIGGVPEPDINVRYSYTDIVSGDMTPSFDDHTDFGSTYIDSGEIETFFVIENTGSADMIIESLNINGPDSIDFEFYATPTLTLTAGQSSGFIVCFKPSETGLREAVINILSNDIDENPYTFAIQGTGILPNSAATIETDTVLVITTNSALIQYSITDLGIPSITQHGVCWNMSGEPSILDSLNNEGPADSTGIYSSNIDTLNSNSLYYVRAYAINLVDTVYGEILSFRTLGKPEVSGLSITNIDSVSVTASASITSLGNPVITQHGFCWNTGGNPTITDNIIELGAVASIGDFSSELSGLVQNTSYFVRAFATNPIGTGYSDPLSFTTIETTISDMLPSEFSLSHNYPNPFNPRTTIGYQLPSFSEVKINIFDMNGKQISTLYHGNQEAGRYELTWNASDMPSGVYIVKMVAGDFIASQKVVLMK